MNLRKSFSIVNIIMLLALILSSTYTGVSPARAEDTNTYYVRIPAATTAEVSQLGLSPRLALDYGAFQWLELSSADFEALSASDLTFFPAPEAGNVQVTGFRFDPLVDGEPDLPSGMQASGSQAGFRLIQFFGPAKDSWLTQLEATGMIVLQYYPYNSFLVWATPTQIEAASRLDFVRWQGLFHPAYKVNGDLEGRRGSITNVDVVFYNDGNIQATLDAIARLGGNIVQHYPSQPDEAFFDAIVQLDAGFIDDIARLETVLWLGYSHPEPVLDDEMSSQIVAGNYTAGVPFVGYNSWLANLGLDGSGVIWAIVDTGVDYDHPDLGSHIIGGYSFPGACDPPGQPGSDCSGGGHGTHVAGIVGGDATAGFADPSGFLYGLGISPAYDIFAMNSLSGPYWPPTGGWQEHSKRAVLGNAIGGNNSWTTGEGTNHGYQASERTHDFMVLDGNFDTPTVAEPFIEVFSAGNSGPGSYTLTAPKEAKNLIVTASSRNYRVGSIDDISGFSSRGPAADGRWVPTVAAPGEQIASARNDLGGSCSTAIPGTNNMYAYCSGTSMAAPHVAGSIVLVTEWWRGFNGGEDPSAEMAKALLVNGAVDMGTSDIPNIHEGWGRINLTNVLSDSTSALYYDEEVLFTDTGDNWEITVHVVDPSKPLKVTLAWADAPGAIGANPALVNNLDLTVVNGSNTYYGNVFSSGWSTPGGSPDTINNLENIYIQNPGSTAAISVNATNIAGDAVLYNGDDTDQDFALVCYNCFLGVDFTMSADPEALSVCAPDPGVYDIALDTIGNFSDTVTLNTVGQPAGTTVDFSVNPVTPPGSSLLTISNTISATVGSYAIDVIGVSATRTHTVTVGLELFNNLPGQPELLAPADGSIGLPQSPAFSWIAATQGASYDLEIATDRQFSNVVVTVSDLMTTTHTITEVLNINSMYFWRVKANNTCGSSYSPVYSFLTQAPLGACPAGTTALTLFSDDLESGAVGWAHGGDTDTWALSDDRTHSGANAFFADDGPTMNDQWLVSPEIALPEAQMYYTLQFWNYQSIQDRATGCYDGAMVEVSTDGGVTWTQADPADLLSDPYDGNIVAGSGNPLEGHQAWCGDPQDWLNSVVVLDAYAGETVQLRFRMGTNNTIAHEGWYIDDVVVQSCQLASSLGPVSILDAAPGSSVTHAFTLFNGQDTSDTYSLEVSGSQWPTNILSANPVTVTAGASTTVLVQVDVPALFVNGLHGTDAFTLTAHPENIPIWSPTTIGTTQAVTNPAVEISPATQALTSTAESMVTYIFTVTNAGNYTDTFTLTVSGTWTATLPGGDSTGLLAAGQSMVVSLTVVIPAEAPGGSADTTTLTAVSTLDSAVSTSAKATTNVAEPWFRIYLPHISR